MLVTSHKLASLSQNGAHSQLLVFRAWQEEIGAGQMEWRGYVHHVLSGEARYIRSWVELVEFLDFIIKKESQS